MTTVDKFNELFDYADSLSLAESKAYDSLSFYAEDIHVLDVFKNANGTYHVLYLTDTIMESAIKAYYDKYVVND